MKVWDDKWLARLEDLRVRLEEAIRFLDGRIALYGFKSGWRWTMGRIKYCKRWEKEDEINKMILEGTMHGTARAAEHGP